MGLESIELVLNLEREFATRLDEVELASIATVGELYDLLLQSQNLRRPTTCFTARLFYQLRRGLIKMGWSRASVRPGIFVERATLQAIYPYEFPRRAQPNLGTACRALASLNRRRLYPPGPELRTWQSLRKVLRVDHMIPENDHLDHHHLVYDLGID